MALLDDLIERYGTDAVISVDPYMPDCSGDILRWVVMEVKPEFRQRPDALDHLFVRSAAGGQVPLSAFAAPRPFDGPLGQPPGPVPGGDHLVQPGARHGAGPGGRRIHEAEREIGLPASVHAAFAGTAQAFRDSLIEPC